MNSRDIDKIYLRMKGEIYTILEFTKYTLFDNENLYFYRGTYNQNSSE